MNVGVLTLRGMLHYHWRPVFCKTSRVLVQHVIMRSTTRNGVNN